MNQKRPIAFDPDPKKRRAFVMNAIERLGGVNQAARKLGVTSAAVGRWRDVYLSVEAAVLIAEALMLPLEAAVQHATRRMVLPESAPPPPRASGRHAAGREAA